MRSILLLTPKQNHLLAALPDKVLDYLVPHLHPIPMPRGWAIYDPGSTLEFAVFPITSIVSVLSLLEDGSSPEVAIIGNDGVVGVAALMGEAATTNTRAVVQSAGRGFRIQTGILRSMMESEPALRDLMLRYVMSLGTQMAQYAVCNRFHLVEQQVCRLLLMCLDRWPSNRLSLTHERKANLLGVRREAVSAASSNLASAGLISYRRGCVTILDRAGLEARSCECYELVKTETDRLLLPGRRKACTPGLMPAI